MSAQAQPRQRQAQPVPRPDNDAAFELAARAPSARRAWRYTARPRWSSAGESIWMRLSKFSLCNRMSVTELAELFSLRDDEDSSDAVDLRRISRWNQQALASTLEISAGAVRASFCAVGERQVITRAATQLRYCAPCLSAGFHAAWFQWLHVERCPLHDLPLRFGCVQCAMPIPYVLGAHLASSPLRCVGCMRDWVPSLARPGGHSSALEPSACRLMLDWADYVRHVVTVDHRLCRDRASGQYVADRPAPSNATTARPHVLTMMNRLFESPPPTWTSTSAATLPETRGDASVPPGSILDPDPHARDAGFDPLHWPHFGGDFVRHEAMVFSAQARLFASTRHRVDRVHKGRLLLDGLVAPSTSMPRDAAAATGWAISWLGASQALAPPTGFTAPPSGLTAWLCKLPLRSPSTPRTAWHEQVARWLADDLQLSARRWRDVAEFMSARGVYLLYGEAVSPLALALRHHAEIS